MLLEKRKMETKTAFRARVKKTIGRYQDIPIADDEVREILLLEGTIFCKRNNVYIVGVDYEIGPEGHEVYHSFVRVIL